jgi:predicted secreted Zn-dependent protease
MAAQAPITSIPGVTRSYYVVTGSTADQVRAAIDKIRPADANDGLRVDALTSSRYAWRWPGNGKGGCDLSRTEVTFTATMPLPRLAEDATLSSAARKPWDAYIRALEAHETTHLANAYSIHGELADAIKSATCETANAAGAQVLAKSKAIDLAFDKRTLHGQTEGVPFP